MREKFDDKITSDREYEFDKETGVLSIKLLLVTGVKIEVRCEADGRYIRTVYPPAKNKRHSL